MQKRKVCMVGDFAVGKTSLTQQFVNKSFSEKYLTTIGVKIDNVVVGDTKLIIWDVAGRDALSPINVNYLSGAAGVVIVADGTRAETIKSLPALADLVHNKIGLVPTVVAINKCDHKDWKLTEAQKNALAASGWEVFMTSALTAENVPELFGALVQQFDRMEGMFRS